MKNKKTFTYVDVSIEAYLKAVGQSLLNHEKQIRKIKKITNRVYVGLLGFSALGAYLIIKNQK